MSLEQRLRRLEKMKPSPAGLSFWDWLCSEDPDALVGRLTPEGKAMLDEVLATVPEGDVPDEIEEQIQAALFTRTPITDPFAERIRQAGEGGQE